MYRSAPVLLLGLMLGGYAFVNVPAFEPLRALIPGFDRVTVRIPTVVVDSWWSGDYAKLGCEQAKDFMRDNRTSINQFGCDAVTACPEVMPRYTACIVGGDPAATARNFEDELMTQFSINPSCKGAAFARYYGPYSKVSASTPAAGDARSWSLIIDYVVGGPTQYWRCRTTTTAFSTRRKVPRLRR
jgi:hypothetical protein